MSNKSYGLIIPEKNKLLPKFQASRNVFGNDSESEEESSNKPMLLRPNVNINRQAKLAQEKAVLEDPTVYQYDEIYDTIATEVKEKKVQAKQEKKPRYIENLMKSASKRKIENERRVERQIQKEREQEGEEFADKEVFVTSAYKKKLEELRLEEEKEKREDYLESIGDVTKQKDLGGFYRHLYEQKLGSEKDNTSSNSKEDKQIITNLNSNKNENDSQKKTEASKTEIRKRNYRKRKTEESKQNLSEGEIEDSDEEINRVNLEDIRLSKKAKQDNIDADSDFSIDDSSDEDADKKAKNGKEDEESVEDSQNIIESKKTEKSKDIVEEPVKSNDVIKPKIDIWKKRTVGEVFAEAMKRYYERKAVRSM